jgi:desulfoferrodoxin
VFEISRRDFMEHGVSAAAALAAGLLLASCGRKPDALASPARTKSAATAPPTPQAAAPAAAKAEKIHRAADPNNVTELESEHVPQFVLPRDLKAGKRIDLTVDIGKVPHPMARTHHLEWAELYLDDRLVQRIELKPGAKPQAVFQITPGARQLMKARVLCNKHGLWEAVMDIAGTK